MLPNARLSSFWPNENANEARRRAPCGGTLFEPLFRFWAIGRLVCVGEPLCAHTHAITHGNVANPLFMGTFVFARAVTEKRIYSSLVV